MRGDIRDAEARQARARRASTPSCTWPRSSAIPPARATRSCPTRSTSRAAARLVADAASRRRASASCSPRPAPTTAAWPTRPCRSTRPASCARCRSTPSRRSRSRSALLEGEHERPVAPPACASRPSTASGHRDALRPHRQRVHARPLGRSASSRSSASSSGAPTSTCATRRARCALVLARRARRSPARVFNAGHSDENYRKLDLVEIITGQLGRGDVAYVHRDEDPRDYKVSFERISDELGFEPLQRVPTASTRSSGRSRRSASATRSRPATRTSADERRPADPALRPPARAARTSRPWRTRCARAGSRWARAPRSSSGPSPSTSAASTRSRCPAAPRRCTSPTWRPASGPGDEVIVPAITFVATAAAARYCGAEPVFADVKGPHDLGIDPEDVERRITDRTKAVCAVHYGGYAADLAALRALCDDAGLALIEDAAHSPSATPLGDSRKLGTYGLAGLLQLLLQQGPVLRRGRPAGHRRRRGRRPGAQPALARDDHRDLGPPPRPRARLRRGRTSATTTAWTSRAPRC